MDYQHRPQANEERDEGTGSTGVLLVTNQ